MAAGAFVLADDGLDPEGLRLLRGYLDHFWDQALAAYKTAVEQQVKENS